MFASRLARILKWSTQPSAEDEPVSEKIRFSEELAARLGEVEGFSHISGGMGLPFRNLGLGLAAEETDKKSSTFHPLPPSFLGLASHRSW